MPKRLLKKGLHLGARLRHAGAHALRGAAKRLEAGGKAALLAGLLAKVRSHNAKLMGQLESRLRASLKNAPFASKKRVSTLESKVARLEKMAKKKKR